MKIHCNALYQIDPYLFRDSDGHGWGTLDGITGKLDYLAELGVSTLWLLPFFVSGGRDGGYDIVDHCAVDPRLGDLAAFDRLVREARRRGIGIVVKLVLQHTSDRHHWFQQARRDPASPFRARYLWRDAPEDHGHDPMFPPVQAGIWTWDACARQYYRHLFYPHEPDLDTAHPAVREEMFRIMEFWLRRGVAGFRIDALPYMVERAREADPAEQGRWLLGEMRRKAGEHLDDPILIGEADVAAGEYGTYLDHGRKLSHLLDFHFNNHLFLALACEDAREIAATAAEYPADAPASTRLMWLRNNDELDLEQLDEDEREQVMRAFAPEPWMRIYGRGIRRRLAPMLGGDVARIAMAHALILSIGQVPVLRYGDEIGMGEELALPERQSVRTPMQWTAGEGAGFGDRPERAWRRPISAGPFGHGRINVAAQRDDPDSLLARVRELLAARRGLPAFDTHCRYEDAGTPGILSCHYADAPTPLLALVNLSGELRQAALPADFVLDATKVARGARPLSDRVALQPYGYCWLQGRRTR